MKTRLGDIVRRAEAAMRGRLLATRPARLWLVAVLLSMLLTEVVVAGMSILLNGQVESDFALTGLVASLLVGAGVSGLITWLLAILRASEARFATIYHSSPLGIALGQLSDGRFCEVNESMAALLGYARGEIVGRTGPELGLWADADERAAFFARLREEGGVRNLPVVFRRKTGETRYLLISADKVDLGGVPHVLALMSDDTARTLSERELKAAHVQLEKLVQCLPMGAMVSQGETLLFCNAELARMLGRQAGELMGSALAPLLPEKDRGLADIIRQAGQAGDAAQAYHEAALQRAGGGSFPARIHARPVDWDGQRAAICLVEDISEHKAAEERIRNLAFFDPLTGLPNRRLMLDRLRMAAAGGQRDRSHGALMFIDLDNFKGLNDTRGHDMGDLLLKEVAHRLEDGVREGDTVARLGGDEFVVLLEGLSTDPDAARTQAERVGAKLLATLDEPYLLGQVEHHGSASMGVALFQGHGEGSEQLLKRADLAMYQAKFAGRNTLRVFEPAMQAALDARSALEMELRRGLRQDEFRLYYQPQVDAHGRVIGAEALVRWLNGGKAAVAPAEFVPLAEESGLILPMGRRILELACAQLAAWAASPLTAGLVLAVNVSVRQFRSPDFVAQVADALHQSGADPRRLKLELTESLLVQDMADTVSKMEALRRLGVRFALDDFGTGYSSLAYLKQLPLAQVKISQTFVRDILSDPNDAAIARAIIAMGRSLCLEVIAEGVETPEQWQTLVAEGCLQGQGYLFGRAVPGKDFDSRPRQLAEAA